MNHITRTENHICVKDTKLANQVYLDIYSSFQKNPKKTNIVMYAIYKTKTYIYTF